MNNALLNEFKKSFSLEVDSGAIKEDGFLSQAFDLDDDHPLVTKLLKTYFVNNKITVNVEVIADEYTDGTWLIREVNIKR
ncbi:hypothetical protein CMI47_13340 [Candidatus Pacearchaeota archaeon]|nr:hypothetical protein [Candidatus Pacearchaeota archaeon]|tara:strand:- start:1317 stop:1556 length:240 start_codon:yes stop_codon:yes gene_type:complete